jgi:hypothetical protein
MTVVAPDEYRIDQHEYVYDDGHQPLGPLSHPNVLRLRDVITGSIELAS